MQSKMCMKQGKDSQSTGIHGWKWSNYRFVYFVYQSLHILLRKENKKTYYIKFSCQYITDTTEKIFHY